MRFDHIEREMTDIAALHYLLRNEYCRDAEYILVALVIRFIISFDDDVIIFQYQPCLLAASNCRISFLTIEQCVLLSTPKIYFYLFSSWLNHEEPERGNFNTIRGTVLVDGSLNQVRPSVSI